MRYLILALCLFSNIQANAQSFKKNEVVIGYGAGYFFDSTAFKISNIDGVFDSYNISLAYTRHLNKRISIGMLFARYQFHYSLNSLPADIKPNTILGRSTEVWGISAGYAITKGVIPIRVKAGFARTSGFKLNFYGYHWLTYEPILEGPGYKNLSASISASIGHPIIWRFFGELEGQYLRVNTDVEPSQFYLSYRIGFKF